jgi:23S rRNA (cytidine1920-2'-O)/16S rRNA (cytidine1409-2'-O)-methyltransferase
MLQHGAALVVAVDTGYGQIAARLRADARVRLLENTNARYLEPGQVPERIELMAVDVSFISATLVLPAVTRAAFSGKGASRQEAIVLVKPQFEAGRGQVGKGGIVRDPQAHGAAVEKVRRAVAELGATQIDVTDSPILGAEGNREFLLHCFFHI